MKENNNKLGKPRRSLIRLIKKIDDVNSIVDIMSIKGTGVVVNKPQWFKEFEEKNDKRWRENDKHWEEQLQFNKFVLNFIKEQKEFNKYVLEFIEEQKQINAKQQDFNQYVLDVFKRNNLK